MRITAGEWRGRKLYAPPGDAVRPTSDKVRQAIFNILFGHGLPMDAQVLDGFCGTGALGLEALSRGAAQAVFMDRARESVGACRRNIDAAGAGGRAILIERDLLKAGRPPGGIAPVSLAFLDPPYRQGLVPQALTVLRDNGWLADGALCVAETEQEAGAVAAPGFTLLDSRAYGSTQILFLRMGGNA